jgi:hypothetical protein
VARRAGPGCEGCYSRRELLDLVGEGVGALGGLKRPLYRVGDLTLVWIGLCSLFLSILKSAVQPAAFWNIQTGQQITQSR